MNTLNKSIGQRISILRKEHHMTQEQLAEALDISIKHLSCVERGISSLSLEKLIEVCSIFDTSLDYLVKGDRYRIPDLVPPSFLEYAKKADPGERQIIKEYLTLFLKLRDKQ